jgi:hypothetical protein
LLKPGAQPHSPIKPHGLHAPVESIHWFKAHVEFTRHSVALTRTVPTGHPSHLVAATLYTCGSRHTRLHSVPFFT